METKDAQKDKMQEDKTGRLYFLRNGTNGRLHAASPQQRDYCEEFMFCEGKEIINGWTGN
jgi:hypothetical protein